MGSQQLNSGSLGIGKNENLKLNIDKLTKEELEDKIKEIQRIRIPFFDNAPLQILSNVVYVTGNSPHHEGLIFKTEKGKIYVAQTYPITFIKVNSYNEAIDKITYFCNLNKYSKNNKIRDVWVPERKNFSVNAMKLFIETLPNKYDLIQENCQFFCKEILEAFPLKKLEEEEYKFIIKGSKTV